jgi:hypothetical protein
MWVFVGMALLLLPIGYFAYMWFFLREQKAGRVRDCPMCGRQIHASAEHLDRLYEDWELLKREKVRRAEGAERVESQR